MCLFQDFSSNFTQMNELHIVRCTDMMPSSNDRGRRVSGDFPPHNNNNNYGHGHGHGHIHGHNQGHNQGHGYGHGPSVATGGRVVPPHSSAPPSSSAGAGALAAVVRPRMPPIMSFKTFMQSQREDLPPESFQKLYDQYHIDYLQDYSDAFFKEALLEEWFQDRYNPARIFGLEQAAREHAAAESAAFKAGMLLQPAECVQAVSLNPPAKQQQLQAKKQRSNSMSSEADAEKRGDSAAAAGGNSETAAVVAASTSTSTGTAPVTRNLAGYEDRALFFPRIPGGCTRSVLKHAVLTALSAAAIASAEEVEGSGGATSTAAQAPAPERIILGLPKWSFLPESKQYKFER
jgi:hypothetical protein